MKDRLLCADIFSEALGGGGGGDTGWRKCPALPLSGATYGPKEKNGGRNAFFFSFASARDLRNGRLFEPAFEKAACQQNCLLFPCKGTAVFFVVKQPALFCVTQHLQVAAFIKSGWTLPKE